MWESLIHCITLNPCCGVLLAASLGQAMVVVEVHLMCSTSTSWDAELLSQATSDVIELYTHCNGLIGGHRAAGIAGLGAALDPVRRCGPRALASIRGLVHHLDSLNPAGSGSGSGSGSAVVSGAPDSHLDSPPPIGCVSGGGDILAPGFASGSGSSNIASGSGAQGNAGLSTTAFGLVRSSGFKAIAALHSLVRSVTSSNPTETELGSGSGSGSAVAYSGAPEAPSSDLPPPPCQPPPLRMYEWEPVQAELLIGLSEEKWGLRPCSNFDCTRLEGPCEMTVKTLVCGGGCGARYCCQACAEQAWRSGHKRNCQAMSEMRRRSESLCGGREGATGSVGGTLPPESTLSPGQGFYVESLD